MARSRSFNGNLLPGQRHAGQIRRLRLQRTGPRRCAGALAGAVASRAESATERNFGARAADAQAQLLSAASGRRRTCAIDGDPATEQALRFNLFHLCQSSSRDGQRQRRRQGPHRRRLRRPLLLGRRSVHAAGAGHSRAGAGARMLAYRIRTLDTRAAHAREMNHARGALYAWRTISGDECSAYFPGRLGAVPHQCGDRRGRSACTSTPAATTRSCSKAAPRCCSRPRASGCRSGISSAPRRRVLHPRGHRPGRIHRPGRQQPLHQPHGAAAPARCRRDGRRGWR